MTTRVYRYGLAAPHEGAEHVHAAIRAAHEYRKRLTEIERERRAALRQVEREMHAPLEALESAVRTADERCEALAVAIRKTRSATRKRSEGSDARAELAAARAMSREAKRALREARETLRSKCADCRQDKRAPDPCPHASAEAISMRAAIDAIGERANEARRKARAESGLFWGTYLLVEDACAKASQSPLYDPDGITPSDPRYPRFDGGGALGIQFQGGAKKPPRTVAQLTTGQDARAKLSLPPAEAWIHAREGGPGRGERHRLARRGQWSMRVGKGGEWASWRLDMHRPLPEGAIVTWAQVHRAIHGPHSEWYLTLSVDAGQPSRSDASVNRTEIVAIDVGWRAMGDELRVAAWQDSSGKTGELRLDADAIAALRMPDEVRSERDRRYEVILLALRKWIDSVPGAPDWMHEARTTMHAWRSQARLVAFWNQWGERPALASEAAIWNEVMTWYWRDRHLWEVETQARLRARRRRREVYRVWAARMVAQYRTIVIEKFDLRAVARRAETGADKTENETARSNRVLADVSELRLCLVNAARTRGNTLAAMPAEDTTRTCPSCGLVQDRPAAAMVVLSCECGHVWDQDTHGAAPVLLARWRERSGDAKILAGARESGKESEIVEIVETRWQRAKRLHAEKEARMRGARKAVGE